MAKTQKVVYYCDMSKKNTPLENLIPVKIGKERTSPKFDLSKENAEALVAALKGDKPFVISFDVLTETDTKQG